jgi:hypothetical protein
MCQACVVIFTAELAVRPCKIEYDGPPLFKEDGSLHIGLSLKKYRPGDEWVKISVTALGEGPLSVGNEQGPDSLIKQLADQKRGPDPESTDIYYEVAVELSDADAPLIQRPGTPTWTGEDLDFDGAILPPGQWKHVTVYSEGWAASSAPGD